MKHRPISILLTALLLFSLALSGCRPERSIAPPVEEIPPEDEEALVVEEALQPEDVEEETELEEEDLEPATGEDEEEPEVVVVVPEEEEELEPAEVEEETEMEEETLEPATTEEETPQPTPTTAAPSPTTAPPASGGGVHVVQRGENLFRIALRYGTTLEALAKANNITNPALIYVGQKLVIPGGPGQSPGGPPPGGSPPPSGKTYVVQPGDNLYRIALRYNYTTYYLARYNNIANPSQIYVGQVIRIP